MPRVAAALASPSARRALWTLVSQGLSSITNFVTALVVARTCTESEFGRFAYAFSLYGLAVGFTKAVAAMPFAMKADPARDAARRRGAAAAGTALLLGLVIGLAYVVGGELLGGEYRGAVVIVGAFLALMCAEESWRTLFIADQRPHIAAALDAVWLVLEVPTFAFVISRDLHTAPPMVAAWALPGMVAGVVGWVLWRHVASAGAAWRYLRSERHLWGFQALEYITVMGANQLALTAIAALGHPAHLGALRGAQTLFAPQTILVAGVGSFVLSEITRRDLHAAGAAGRWGGALSIGLGVFGLLWGGLLLLLPDAAGREILGATWDSTDAVMPAMVVQAVSMGLAQGPMILMFSRADSKGVFRVSAATAIAILVLAVAGERFFGMQGAAWGFALANAVTLPLWYLTGRRALAMPAPA